MFWLSVSFEADADRIDPLTDALLEAGALAADVSDAAAGTSRERPIFGEPGAETGRRWQRSRVSALFPADIELSAALEQAFRAAGVAVTTPYQVDRVDNQDWVRVTQSQFTPQQISQRLWVVPTWHTAPDPQATNIVLDPGLGFGKGVAENLALNRIESVVQVLDHHFVFGS